MPTDVTEGGRQDEFSFLKGDIDIATAKTDGQQTWAQSVALVREHVTDALSARHISFLLGSGCSSLVREDNQLGIPTMRPLSKVFTSSVGQGDDSEWPTVSERDTLKFLFAIDLAATPYADNIETLLELLLSLQFVLKRSGNENLQVALTAVESVIQKAKRFILKSCTDGPFSAETSDVVALYQSFYRRLIYRDRSLPRPWVFTTNYDLFNEMALDRLAIPYCNGFSGVVERRFNPATFRYSLGEQLDISSRKWTAAENYIYLCKLHGSVNWIEEAAGLFPIRELQTPSTDAGGLMIYPTPAKGAASLGSPYADLFREFQSRIVREQSVLFVLGYSFADAHVNNMIFQALTVPTFRLVAFVSPKASGAVAQLRQLGDPRVWIIGGEGPSPQHKAHHFDSVVEHFMPEMPGDRIDRAVSKVLDTLLRGATADKTGEDDAVG